MKQLTLVLAIGLAASVTQNALADDYDDDLIYGHRGPVTPSLAEAPDIRAQRKNQQQEDDRIYGYRNTGTASRHEPPVDIPLQKNQSQEDDVIYGYRN